MQIASGHYHSLALKADGTLWGFGYNLFGQLGNGTNSNSSVPVLVGVQNMTLISAGELHSVAVRTSSNTSISIAAATQVFGATIVKARVTLGRTGFPLVRRKVTLSLDGSAIGDVITDASGWASLPYLVGVGTHKVLAYAPQDSAMKEAIGRGVLKVIKSGTTLKAYGASVRLGETASIKAKLRRNSDGVLVANQTISFTLDGTAIGNATTNNSGVATLLYKSDGAFAIGKHKIVATFAGDANHKKDSAPATLIIHKGVTAIRQKNASGKASAMVDLLATLKRKADAPLGNRTVNFYVDGKLVGSAKTDSNGIATLGYTLPSVTGVYPMKVVFDGDASYSASSYDRAKLTVR